MATITPTVVGVNKNDGSTYLVTWTPVTESDTFGPVFLPEYADKSVHVTGTFGSCTLAVHGSNDGVNYAALNDASSTVIGIQSDKIKQVLENTAYVKPIATGGSAQSLTVAMLFRMSNPLRT